MAMREMRRFFFSSRRRHTRYWRDWSSDVCSSDLKVALLKERKGWYGEILGELQNQGQTDAALTDADARKMKGAHGQRSEERRVGKECRCRRARGHNKKKWRSIRGRIGCKHSEHGG